MRSLRKTMITLRQGWLTISSPHNSFDLYSQRATLSFAAARRATSPMSGLRAPQSYNCVSRGCFSSSSEATEVTSTVPNAVNLCDAREPIMQKAAANRVRMLAEMDNTLKELIDCGVCVKLLRMLKPDIDAGVAQAVLAALKEISRLPEGREALLRAGADKTLSEAMHQQWLPQQDQTNEEAKKIRDWLRR